MLSIIPISVAFCIGVWLGLTHHASSIIAGVCGIIFCTQLVIYFACRVRKAKSELPKLFIVCSLFIILGILRGQAYTPELLPSSLYGKNISFDGEVASDVIAKESTIVFEVAPLIDDEKQKVHIQITAPLYPQFVPGDVLHIVGEVKEGDVILPDGVTSFESFDYKKYLDIHGIGGTMIYPKIEKVGATDSFAYSLLRLKESMIRRIEAHAASPQSALLEGVLLGTDSFPKEDKDAFRVAGISHIVVLSGFNVAILVVFVMYLFKKLPLIVRIVSSASVIALFLIFVGAEASLVRASIMVYIALLFLFLGRQYDALYALFFSLFLYVLIYPESLLYNVSLHLSFLATLGIILFTEFFSTQFTKIKYISFAKEVLATTCAVLLVVTPYTMHTFSSFSLYSVIANVFTVPVVPALMLLSLLLIVVSSVPVVSTVVSLLAYGVSYYVIEVARFFTALPYSKVVTPLSFTGMCFMYICIALLYCVISRKKKEMLVTNTEGIISGVVSF